MCIYITRGDSCSTWLWSAVCMTPPSCSFVITGITSSSVSTRSPITIVSLPIFLKATHEPSASAGLTATPPTVTCKSLRGRLTLYTSPGCIEPSLPNACPTAFQSVAPDDCAALLLPPCPLSGAEQATKTSTVIKNVTVATTANCLNLLMTFLPFSLISSSVLARVSLFDRRCEHERTNDSNDSGDDERHLRRELPEESADGSRGRDRDAAHQVVKPDGARPQVCLGE